MNKKSFGLFWRVYTTDIVWSLAIEFVSSPFKETNSLTTSASRSSANLCKNYKKQYFIYFTYMIKNKYFSFSFMSAILTLVIWNILDNTFNAKSNWLYMIGVYCWTEILTIDHLHFFIRTDINLYYIIFFALKRKWISYNKVVSYFAMTHICKTESLPQL